MVKSDGGNIGKAVERCRLRLRELAADLHRARSAPWPSSVAKASATELINRLADQGQPNLDGAIEHGAPVAFATARVTSTVYNVQNSPGAVAYAEHFDALAALAYFLKDQMIAKIHADLDAVADDKHALDEQARATVEAQILSDMLSAERAECSLIWHADVDPPSRGGKSARPTHAIGSESSQPFARRSRRLRRVICSRPSPALV
jgi:hypothetical protein